MFASNQIYFIAEIGPNHDGILENALQLIPEVAASGADAIKFQTYQHARTVVSNTAPLAAYMEGSDRYDDQIELLEQVRLTFDEFEQISEACAQHNIAFASTPFDVASVDFLMGLGVPFLKVPSGEITNKSLLEAVAKTMLPLVISTGMATISEVREALDLIYGVHKGHAGGPDEPEIVLLHCTSAYPANQSTANLSAMGHLASEFGLPTGYSDHTVGWAVPIAAAALGAVVVEKHVTPDPQLPGPDHKASLPISELKDLISHMRAARAAVGTGEKTVLQEEVPIRSVARRSLAAARDISAGEIIQASDLVALRPETGISPMKEALLVGRRAKSDYCEGEILSPSELAD